MLLAMLLAVTTIPRLNVPTLKSVTLSTTSVIGGNTVNGTVTLGAAAPQALTVKISSSSSQFAEVPQSVTVQPGAVSAAFIVQTHPVSMNPSVVGSSPPTVKISAQVGSQTPVESPLTVLPATLVSLTLNPSSIATAATSTGTVTINGPAASGGMTIALHPPSGSSERTLVVPLRARSLMMPSSVTIPAGATSATFTIRAGAAGSYEIDASWGPFVTKSATLTVTAPDLVSITPAYLGAKSGGDFSGRVNISGPAPEGGLVVNLKTALAYGGTTGTFAQCGALPSVPATVTVPVGATSAALSGKADAGYGVFWVIASTPTKTAQVGMSVDSPSFDVILPASVKGGTVAQGKIRLTSGAMSQTCGNRYTLTSSNTTDAQVPSYVDVPTGATEASFSITTVALPTSSQALTVTITGKGFIVNNNAPAPAKQYPMSKNLTITP